MSSSDSNNSSVSSDYDEVASGRGNVRRTLRTVNISGVAAKRISKTRKKQFKPVKACARCWLCEFHTHPLAMELSAALVDNSKSVNSESIAVMICKLLSEKVACKELVIDSEYPISKEAVLVHIVEHVVDARVQLPNMIRSLQCVYSGLCRNVNMEACDEICDDDESEVDNVVPNKAYVDSMVKVSSQLAVLYRFETIAGAKAAMI